MAETKPLVLIVNDDEAMRNALQFALRLEGIEVHVHANGADLLADLDLRRGGCLIMNDRMPHMNGFEVMNFLRDNEISLPAILLTSVANTALRARATNAGVCLVLEKPILDNALIEGVMSILSYKNMPAK
jgi:FixJ family two-component response regulator